MSEYRQQAFIEAPVRVVWDLIADVDHHPEWWPRIVEVRCEGLEEGCTYRQVTQTPFGKDEMNLRVESLDDCEDFLIRCLNTGTFVHFALTEAQDGTFVDARIGMDPPLGVSNRVFDAVAGKRYFRRWMQDSLEAMQRVAAERASAAAA
jgi:uncharacterized protein YndB with AHSA1/START domain